MSMNCSVHCLRDPVWLSDKGFERRVTLWFNVSHLLFWCTERRLYDQQAASHKWKMIGGRALYDVSSRYHILLIPVVRNTHILDKLISPTLLLLDHRVESEWGERCETWAQTAQTAHTHTLAKCSVQKQSFRVQRYRAICSCLFVTPQTLTVECVVREEITCRGRRRTRNSTCCSSMRRYSSGCLIIDEVRVKKKERNERRETQIFYQKLGLWCKMRPPNRSHSISDCQSFSLASIINWFRRETDILIHNRFETARFYFHHLLFQHLTRAIVCRCCVVGVRYLNPNNPSLVSLYRHTHPSGHG